SNPRKLHVYDLQIDRTFHRLLRSLRSSEVVNSSSLNNCAIASNVANFGSNFDFDPFNIVDSDIADFDSNFGVEFGVRGSTDNQILENKITELTPLVKQLSIGQHHISPLVRVCGICAFVEHPTNVCPTLQEIEPQRYQLLSPFKQQQPMQPVQQSSLEDLVK
ncbi:hypothetical protein CR513_21839, partial [Mucuna pruriens]